MQRSDACGVFGSEDAAKSHFLDDGTCPALLRFSFVFSLIALQSVGETHASTSEYVWSAWTVVDPIMTVAL